MRQRRPRPGQGPCPGQGQRLPTPPGCPAPPARVGPAPGRSPSGRRRCSLEVRLPSRLNDRITWFSSGSRARDAERVAQRIADSDSCRTGVGSISPTGRLGFRESSRRGRRSWCSNASRTGHGGCWCWRRRKRACSITASSVPSTFSWASSTKVRGWRPRLSSNSGSRWRPSGRRWRRPSGSRARPPRARPPSRPGPRRSSSCPCARRCSSATTTSAPSTCSSASSARARAWPPRSW